MHQETVPTSPKPPLLPLTTAAGDGRKLERWLLKTVGDDGVPRALPVADWWRLLDELLPWASRSWGDWPESLRVRVRGLLLAAMRFSRTDGTAVFSTSASEEDRAGSLRAWLKLVDDPGLATVASWWFRLRRRSASPAAPPLPAFGEEGRPLAMLRPDWRADGDFLAIDHRAASESPSLELQAAGATLLGPSWDVEGITSGRPRGQHWLSSMYADHAEWSFRVGDQRFIRSVVLLRGRKLALLGEQRENATGDVCTTIRLAPGVEAGPVPRSRALSLKASALSARAIPLGLPALPYATDRGSLVAGNGQLVLTQRAEPGRTWLPLLLSWDKGRNRRVPVWRRLTVSERSKTCPPGVACAARVAWGPGDGLVVYRSLGRPGLRSFLGYQTSAKFLVGLFDEKGDVMPLLKVED